LTTIERINDIDYIFDKNPRFEILNRSSDNSRRSLCDIEASEKP
jgi:hypothetical protein